jgi:hypothetical protein
MTAKTSIHDLEQDVKHRCGNKECDNQGHDAGMIVPTEWSTTQPTAYKAQGLYDSGNGSYNEHTQHTGQHSSDPLGDT